MAVESFGLAKRATNENGGPVRRFRPLATPFATYRLRRTGLLLQALQRSLFSKPTVNGVREISCQWRMSISYGPSGFSKLPKCFKYLRSR